MNGCNISPTVPPVNLFPFTAERERVTCIGILIPPVVDSGNMSNAPTPSRITGYRRLCTK